MPDNEFWPVRISIYHPRGVYGNVDIVKYYHGKDPVQLLDRSRRYVDMDKDIKAFVKHKNPHIKEVWSFEADAETYTIYTNETNGRLLARKYTTINGNAVLV